MGAKIIDGKAISAEVNEETRMQVEELKKQGVVPGLAVILVGENPASRVYVNSQ